MKHITLKLFLLATLVLGTLLPAGSASAAGASISMTSNKTTVSAGSSVVVALYVNGGGTPINAVQVDLTYPASSLQYVGVNFSGGAFEIGAAAGGGNGSVSIARGTTSTISGSALIGTITFKALTSSGSATISVSNSSSLVSPDNPTASIAYYGAPKTINFGVVAATPTGPSAPAAPAPPKDTTAPKITDIKASAVTPLSITINWKTDENADSVVEYGIDTNYGLSGSSGTQTTTHAVALNSTFLTPQTSYHYRVKSTDAAGNVTTSADQEFQLPGIPVTIVVRGPNGKPQAGATVTIDNATGVTDAKGQVTLPSGVGDKKVTTVYQGVSVQKPITVDRTAKTLPPYQLDLSRQPLNRWVLVSIGLFVLVISLLSIDALLFGSHFFARFAGLRYMPRMPLAVHHSADASPVATAPPAPKPEPTSTPEVDALDITTPSATPPTEQSTIHHVSTAVPANPTITQSIPIVEAKDAPVVKSNDQPVVIKKNSAKHSQHKLSKGQK